MASIMDLIFNDKEISQIKIEWLELDFEYWHPFNFDKFEGIDDYKKHLKEKLNELKNLSYEEKEKIRKQQYEDRVKHIEGSNEDKYKKERKEFIQKLKENFKNKFNEEYKPL